jgi:hypothetical protein
VTDKFVCPECSSQLYVLFERWAKDRYLVNPATGEVEQDSYETEDDDGEFSIRCTKCRKEVSGNDMEDWNADLDDDGKLIIGVGGLYEECEEDDEVEIQ